MTRAPHPTQHANFVSIFDLFSIGIGPSSSHTVGSMRAARSFASRVVNLENLDRLTCTLYGSLASTGIGHGTPAAILAGLTGAQPETVDPDRLDHLEAEVAASKNLLLMGRKKVTLDHDWITFDIKVTDLSHPNTLQFQLFDATGKELAAETYFSIGGGFIEREGEPSAPVATPANNLPYTFCSATELLEICEQEGHSIAEVMWANEITLRDQQTVSDYLQQIWQVMKHSIDHGLSTEGLLPGRLQVKRRAASLANRLEDRESNGHRDTPQDWLQAYAIAVNEENAAGQRVVTAPTNGAAGIIPAVLRYALDFTSTVCEKPIEEFLLVAGAIGALYKRNASISGAEAGCQGEVGSATSMAAGALCHVLGGNPHQVENAAEIAMEHSLGLTCDPVDGLVQLPCIERNAIGASKAVAAVRLALAGDGIHVISLDTVIETMRQTGLDMSTKYKETSQGGLAVNVVEC